MTADERRDKRNGRYAHDLDAMCVCGLPKGDHEAEPPWAIDDACMGPPCPGFKKARSAKKSAA